MDALKRVPTWLWAAIGFVLGSTVVMVLPASWIFVQEEHAGEAAAGEEEVWACPMLCVKLDGPGECPVCGMDMERIEDTGEKLLLNERERALVELETDEVERRVLTHTIRTFGKLEFNQRRVERISAWIDGRITRLFADTQYTEVRQGDHLFEIYSPELYAAQTEFLTAGGGRLAESAKQKLILAGMIAPQIDALRASGQAAYTTVIHSPATGTIFELNPREGDYVTEGDALYTIADYDTMWLMFDAYETDLPWLQPGQNVTVNLEAEPGRDYPGTIEFIDKAVDPESRTVKVRVVIDNPDHTLKPGMFASVEIEAVLGADGRAATPSLAGRYTCPMHPEVHMDEPGECPICGMPVELHPSTEDGASMPSLGPPKLLSIPRTAVLDTGVRQLVYVMTTPPKVVDGEEAEPAAFEAREIELGPRAGEYVLVKRGLQAGERVVTRGNFLIDSQMELLGKPSLLHPGGGDAPADPHAGH